MSTKVRFRVKFGEYAVNNSVRGNSTTKQRIFHENSLFDLRPVNNRLVHAINWFPFQEVTGICF